MNIVHVEDFFHPEAGYQINILPKYMSLDGHNVTIVTSKLDKIPENLTSFFGKENISNKDDNFEKVTGVKIIRVDLVNFISGRSIFKNKLFEIVDKLNPDILYVHGNDTFTGIRYLLKYKKLKYPIIMDSHMLEMASVNRFSRLFHFFYKNIITPIIIKNKIPVIRTQNDSYIEKKLGVPLTHSPWISVGSDTILFKKDLNSKKELRAQYNINKEDFVVLYTGKLDEAKGGMFLAETFQKKIKSNKKIILIIVGNTVGPYGERIDEILKKSENDIIRFPTQKYIDLPQFYQMADLSIFPKQCSLSFFDAQACGLPVVFEGNVINKSRVIGGNAVTFDELNIESFRDKILYFSELNSQEYNQHSEDAVKFIENGYDYRKIYNRYMKIIIDEVSKFEFKQRKGEVSE